MNANSTFSFEQSSFLPGTSQESVWSKVGNWGGVNEELGPLVSIVAPPQYADLSDIPADGKSYFTATVKLFGLIPIDRHEFAFVDLDAPRLFSERSSNMSVRMWSHKRFLIEKDNGVEIIDKCEFEPRISSMGRFLRAIYIYVFRNRHKHLAHHFAPK